MGAKKAGASKQAILDAMIGTVAVRAGKVGYGTLFGLVLGAAMKIVLPSRWSGCSLQPILWIVFFSSRRK